MPLTICNIEQAQRIAPEFDFVISIVDPEVKFPKLIDNHIVVNMEDTDTPNETEFIQQRSGVFRILAWAQDKKITLDDNILVHCHAGVSRSSAMSWCLLVLLGMSETEAFDYIYSRRPEIWPNMSLMSFGDTYLKKEGNLYKLAKQKNRLISVRRGISSEMDWLEDDYRSPYGG